MGRFFDRKDMEMMYNQEDTHTRTHNEQRDRERERAEPAHRKTEHLERNGG